MTKDILDSVFKSYDIRGKTPEELSPEFFYLLGKAYVTRFKPSAVAVGHDIRPESYIFKQNLIKGILEMGCDVIDLGEIATEMLYFAVGEFSSLYDGGLIITASHNPQGWNGCKMVAKGSTPVGKDTGLEDIKEIMALSSYKQISEFPGSLSDFYIYPEFKSKILSFLKFSKKPTRTFKVIVDAGNGIGGRVFDYIFGSLENLNISRIYFVPDGSFPHHVPDPMKDENVTDLRKRVLEENADLGIAIDGDADRVFFVDKKGRKPDGVYTGVLLARFLLANSENKRIVHDPRIVWPFEKEASALGAETFQSVAGHAYFKKKMAEAQALFGAEASSHFYYKDFYNCDSAMTTIATMLNMYFEGFELTDAVNYLFSVYPNSGEVNYVVENAPDLLIRIEKNYANLNPKIDHIDGVSIEFDDWRFNLRASNTQPLVRLNLEAKSKDLVVEKFREVESLIGVPRENSPALEELI